MSSSYKVTLIPGDGIGPEVVNAAVRILEATRQIRVGKLRRRAEAFEKYHEYIQELTESIERTHVGLKGGDHAHRRRILQHQCRPAQAVRTVRQLPAHPQSAAVPTRYPRRSGIVRENTEGSTLASSTKSCPA